MWDLFVLSEKIVFGIDMQEDKLGFIRDRCNNRPNIYIISRFYEKNNKKFSLRENKSFHRPKRNLIE